MAVTPLEKYRAGSAPRTDRANIPGWAFLCFLLFFFAVNRVWAVDSSRHISQYGHTAWRIQDGVLSGAACGYTNHGWISVDRNESRPGALRWRSIRSEGFSRWNAAAVL